MKTIPEFEDFVKRQVRYHEKRAFAHRNDPKPLSFHSEYADTFKEILAYISESSNRLQEQSTQIESLLRQSIDGSNLASAGASPKVPPKNAHALTSEDLDGLPKELLEQLNIPESNKEEMMIVDLINEVGGVISLDKLLIGIYRKTKEVPQKKTLMPKLYRMIDKKLIYKVPDKKALYTTEPMPDSEQSATNGSADE